MEKVLPVDQFLERVLDSQPFADIDALEKAYRFALEAHADQTRYSGDPYIIHPIATGLILAEWRLDTQSIMAGLLNDTVEDGEATIEEIADLFGKKTANLVDGVTKVSTIQLRGSQDEAFVENLRKMVVAMSDDLRVVLVKLADRLHNMRTLQYVPKHKQKRIAQETMGVYSPLADRLGMGLIKKELDDLAFPFVDRQAYDWLLDYSAQAYQKAEDDMHRAGVVLRKALDNADIEAKVRARTKGMYSLYRKLSRADVGNDINNVNDLVAMRILVSTVEDCYRVLGLVHTLWKPASDLEMRDFVAQPKPNGYRSLHTKVVIDRRIVEVQIRTQRMHHEAEYGIASHWYYEYIKSNKVVTSSQLDEGTYYTPTEQMHWVAQLNELMKEAMSGNELIADLSLDLFNERIFVFTPHGDVIDLPQGATPVDFAHAIHTKLGQYIQGAKVNGKLVPLDYKLENGQVCEIVKSKNPRKPSRDWLDFVVTGLARRHIARHYRE